MKRSVLEDSSNLQQMVASGSSNWWHMNSPSQPPVTASSLLTSPPPTPTSSWNVNQDFLDSWSQPIMGEFLEEQDKSSLINNMQDAKLDNFEEQYEKQEYSSAHSFNNKNNGEFEDMTIKKPLIWSQHIMPTFSSRSSCVTSSNLFDFSIKSDARHPPPEHSSESKSSASGISAKKARVQPSSSQSTVKVRKEKLGDRITALHQIVCPFGKTDTASVLLEAIGYIRFLQNQIEALSVPYLVSESGNMKQIQQRNPIDSDEAKKDLSSRGLCLVPISCTSQVETDNGADNWAPALGGNFK